MGDELTSEHFPKEIPVDVRLSHFVDHPEHSLPFAPPRGMATSVTRCLPDHQFFSPQKIWRSSLAAQGFDLLHDRRRRLARHTVGARGAIVESGSSLLSETTAPLTGGAPADLERGCSRVQGHTLLHRLRQLLSTTKCQSGILMNVHSVLPVGSDCLAQSASPVSAGWTIHSVNNLLKLHTWFLILGVAFLSRSRR
jgi:hypothetical protein